MQPEPTITVEFTHHEARCLARLVDMWCNLLDTATDAHAYEGGVPPLESAAMKLAVALVSGQVPR